MKYLIWSVEHSGWWGPNECGYVKDPAQAGRYDALKADDICAKANVACAQGYVNEVAIPEAKVVYTRPTHLSEVPEDFKDTPFAALIAKAGRLIECGVHVVTAHSKSDSEWKTVLILEDQEKHEFVHAFSFDYEATMALMLYIYKSANTIEKQSAAPGARS